MTTRMLASALLALILAAITTTTAKATSGDDHRYDLNVTSGHTERVRAGHNRHYARHDHQTRQHRAKQPNRIRASKVQEYATQERPSERKTASATPQILPHPNGCPARAFCGCGASIEVFGRSIRELWLAANWFRFPATAPAAGMVAVRRHHVFVIREVRGNGMVLAYDANSGRHQTRLHVRSLAGYRVVNPHGSRYASAS